jgi:hypothetical protein
VIVTVATVLAPNPVASVTLNVNVNTVGAIGALKVGVGVVAPLNTTAVPPTCTHK